MRNMALVSIRPASIRARSSPTRIPSRAIAGRWATPSRRFSQPGTGLEHPHALAADLFDRGGVERRPAQSSFPYGDTAISHGDETTYSTQCSVPTPIPASSGETLPAVVTVAPPSQFVSDGGVVYAFNNVPFSFIGANIPNVAGEYGMSPEGSYIFGPADQGKPVVITYTTKAAGELHAELDAGL